MKKIFKGIALVSMVFLIACGSNTNERTDATTKSSNDAPMEDSLMHPPYEVSMVDNKKDPSCGMPVTAGISDTVHYQNKVLGFCSTECKQAFLENPAANLAAAAIK